MSPHFTVNNTISAVVGCKLLLLGGDGGVCAVAGFATFRLRQRPGRRGALASRGAATLVEGVGGDLGGAGHRVAVDSAVELDHRSFGRHGEVAVLCRPVVTVKENQEAPVELRGGERNIMSR